MALGWCWTLVAVLTLVMWAALLEPFWSWAFTRGGTVVSAIVLYSYIWSGPTCVGFVVALLAWVRWEIGRPRGVLLAAVVPPAWWACSLVIAVIAAGLLIPYFDP